MTDRLATAGYRILAPRASISGTSDSVAAINPTPLADGAMVFCLANHSNYRLDKNSTAAADGVQVLSTVTGVGRWLLEASAPAPETFTGDVQVVLDTNRYATYTGAVGAINFTAAALGHVEQNVKSYRIPANGATAVNFAAGLNVNILDSYDPAQEYLVAFTYFSGRIVGSARIVQ